MTVAQQPDPAASSTTAPGDTHARTSTPSSAERAPRDVIADELWMQMDGGLGLPGGYLGYADDVLDALTAAGWRLERDDHTADLNRMADGREQYLRGAARDPRTAADLAALSSDDLALWVEVQTWRSAARLVAGDREVLFSMPSWCWSDEMVRSLRKPGEEST